MSTSHGSVKGRGNEARTALRYCRVGENGLFVSEGEMIEGVSMFSRNEREGGRRDEKRAAFTWKALHASSAIATESRVSKRF